MKKLGKIKTRIIATALSAITVFSVGTLAFTSASAAELPSTGNQVADLVLNKGYGRTQKGFL